MKTVFISMLVLGSSVAWSQSCDMPANRINIAGIGLQHSFADFKQQHSTATKDAFGSDGVHIKFKNSSGYLDGEDAALTQQGVTSAMHIALNPKTDRITSYALNFTDGGLADYDTPLDSFYQRITQKYNLPKQGWRKHGDTYSYRCQDYRIDISQDHGAARQSMGAVVVVVARDSDMFEAN